MVSQKICSYWNMINVDSNCKFSNLSFIWIVAVFENNSELKNRLETKALPTREFIQLNLGDGHGMSCCVIFS